jgi:hypothetical protein
VERSDVHTILPRFPTEWITWLENSRQTEFTPKEEVEKKREEFFSSLKIPRLYEVDCFRGPVLVSLNALEKGVCFEYMKFYSFSGEERYFCMRAEALGFPLFIDTYYPAYHIYRESDLQALSEFKSHFNQEKHRLTLSMIVKNEENRYLKNVLESAREYITDAVIIDDGSTDNTIQLCRETLKGIPLKMVLNTESQFHNEIVLRKQQWEETVKTNPEWVIILDADEIMEKKFKDEVSNLMSSTVYHAYSFPLYDMWNETHYRDDCYWRGHHGAWLLLLKYNPDITYYWKETAQHCGRIPLTISTFPGKVTSLRVKHYGWARKEDRKAKYDRYMKLDPGSRYGWKEQYDSILDENPHLVCFEE